MRTHPQSSKSVVLFTPPTSSPDFHHHDVTPFDCGNNTHIPVVSSFSYLGSTIDSSAMDHSDVVSRISKASKAFGALQKPVFKNKYLTRAAKTAIFRSAILPIALYGSECWSLTAADEHSLQVFFNRCVRSINNVSKWSQRHNRISSESLRKCLKLPNIKTLLARKLLRWAGHIVRMKNSRLPRRLLSAWCAHKRPMGGPKRTYGRGIIRQLHKSNIDVHNWDDLAQDRVGWRRMLKKIS